ncbi:MAG: hypothetical protein AAF226_09495, partial [Verrucomicrobiota bacterium]
MTEAIQADALDAGSQERVVNTATLQYDNIAGENDEQRIETDEDVALVGGLTPNIEKIVFDTQLDETGSEAHGPVQLTFTAPDILDPNFELAADPGNGLDGSLTDAGDDHAGDSSNGEPLVGTGWIFTENAGVTAPDSDVLLQSLIGGTATHLSFGTDQVGYIEGEGDISQTVEGFTTGVTYNLNMDSAIRGTGDGTIEIIFEAVDGSDTQTFSGTMAVPPVVSLTAVDEAYHMTIRLTDGYENGLREQVYNGRDITDPTRFGLVNESVQATIRAAEDADSSGVWAILDNNETIVYTGQFFDADGVFAFAEHIDDDAMVIIDGTTYLQDVGGSNRPTTTGTLDIGMGPNGDGWHDIEIRFANGGGIGGPRANDNEGWGDANFGFGVDDDLVATDFSSSAEDEYSLVPAANLRTAELFVIENLSFEVAEDLEVEPEDLTIGELVTYHIQIEVPEGTTENLVVTDLLPSVGAGDQGTLTFVEAYIVDPSDPDGGPLADGSQIGNFTQADGTTALTAGDVTITPATPGGQETRFEFGTVVTEGDNDFSNNIITVAVVAFADNLPENVDGDLLTNTATLNYDALVDGELVEQKDTDTAHVHIVEPLLDIEKTVAQTAGDAGDVFDYTLTVTHDENSTAAAFDVAVADLLSDSRLDLVPGSVDIKITPAISYMLNFPTSGLSAGDAADFRDSNGHGWHYLWNAPSDWTGTSSADASTGGIGVSVYYELLRWTGDRFTVDGNNADNDGSPGSFLRLHSNGVNHPGRGSTQSEGAINNSEDRYVIAAYTVPTAGAYSIVSSSLDTIDDAGTGNDVRVFVNDTEIAIGNSGDGAIFSFDGALGNLSAGDTIYVAAGPQGHD